MTPRGLAERLYPTARIREIAAGANHVFRIANEDGSTAVVKVYPVASREKRERRALEALAGIDGLPRITNHGVEGEMAWLTMTDGGAWNLNNLPKNLEVVEAAGQTLRKVHSATAEITNLVVGIDTEYVRSHYRSTIQRLGRFRRRFNMRQEVLDRALQIEPPLATDPVPAHTRPTPSKFVVNEAGGVMLVDWEWATLGPPEWDLPSPCGSSPCNAAKTQPPLSDVATGRSCPRADIGHGWPYHAAMMMLEAAEQRDGRLGDLSYLLDDLTEAVMG